MVGDKLLDSIHDIEYSKYINYFLVGYAFMVPISKAGTNLFEFFILLFWILEGRWKYKFNRYKENKFIVILLLFIIFSLISVLWAASIVQGLDYVAKYRHFLIILVFYTSLEKRFVQPVISAFLVSMFISEVVSYGIFFEWWTYRNISPSYPTPFMDHISYSVYLTMTAMILMHRIIYTDKNRLFYMVFFVSVVVNLFVNGGRTGQVGFILVFIFTLVYNFQSKIRFFTTSIVSIILIVVVAYNSSPNFHNRVNQAKNDLHNMAYSDNYNSSLGIRVLFWTIGGAQALDNLFTVGSGIGNEMKEIEHYAKEHGFNYSSYLASYADHHNIFVTYSIQLGIIGLLLILLMFYFLARLPISTIEYKSLSYVFVILFISWSFTGITLHVMNGMVFFSLFAGLFSSLASNQIKLAHFVK
jgi:O-antigen ligase